MILIDSSVWIYFLNGKNSPERQALHKLINDKTKISITEIIITEVLQGIRQERDFEAVRTFFDKMHIHKPKSTKTYVNAAHIYRKCRGKGKTVRRTIDCVIAAICIDNNIPILHRDSDFDMIAACTELRVLKV
jgi:predicted nucleic acid-binding protein